MQPRVVSGVFLHAESDFGVHFAQLCVHVTQLAHLELSRSISHVPEALSDLINIPRVAITVIDGVRDDALKALVTPALVNELAKIDAAA